ncbi:MULTISPECIES: VOC family protein [unclassified Ruegeria]|uniref:VOC family protein n=1 Tax=unclassified Ruegeria TaxID=2625375 RepID=UPI001ADC62D0|nr:MULTISPECIES: VOC family protein [unclassified Ruegeria]MBO9413861.1 VOC family protein [Ruegeria sp. R8_1]MBO9417786.1 VOC family protein [Ruegeria sp. R8_2]
METVNGIGGVFFRAENPKALAAWYEKHLGVNQLNPLPWKQREGYTVFAPFAQETEYFGRLEQQWMINFRVDDLAAMTAQLEGAGIAVETNPEWNSEVGLFARIHDPEGNPVELWQPNQ